MTPGASQALLFACLAVPVAAVARFNWARRRELAADVGPELGPLDDHGDAVESERAARRRAALTGHQRGCLCEQCLTLAWFEAFGAECEAEMAQRDQRHATGEIA